MRSAREIAHRLRQELRNVALLMGAPQVLPNVAAETGRLPNPRDIAPRLRGTPYAEDVLRIAAEIRQHRFPLVGMQVDTGPEIRWRRDYINAVETDTKYFRLVPYLDPERAGDHKIIWELNRHQHLVLLAQAYLLGGDEANLDEIENEIDSWLAQNPFQRGINWASALEVAFRALSWLWLMHLCPQLRTRLIGPLQQHGLHLENNLSFYFSPNTHLLGEAVALHAIATLLPGLAEANRWRELGARVVAEQIEKQVRDDGSHFEQSTYYHVYALDMFLFHALLGDVPQRYRTKLERMAEYLDAILGPSRRLPFMGDDDGGRFFHPYGARELFGRGTLATCAVMFNRPEWLSSGQDACDIAAWWMGARALELTPAPQEHTSRLFPDAGVAIMAAGDRQVVIDAGPFGPWGSGHSHSDTLSLVVRSGEEDILIDPGTYTYMGRERNWFRGSDAHNTVRIDGADQAIPVNPFQWSDQPSVRMNAWETSASEDYLDAQCEYRGFTHRRRVRFQKPGVLAITDDISGPAGERVIEQLWHPGSDEAAQRLVLEGEVSRGAGWRSDAFGQKRESAIVRVCRRSELPVRMEARVVFSGQ